MWIAFLSTCLAWCQTDGHLLSPSSNVTETLAANAEASFSISVPENQTLELEILARQGEAGLFTVLSPDGKELAVFDAYRRRRCVDRMLIPPGAARIHVEPMNHATGERVFELLTGPLRPLNEKDRLRISAEQLLSEAERYVRENGDDRLAIAAYQKSLAVWAELGDRTQQGYTLLQIADREQVLGELKPALAHNQQAFDLWTAAGDTSCTAEALRQMASVEADLGEKGKAEEHAAKALAISRDRRDTSAIANGLLLEGQLLEASGQSDRARTNYSEAAQLALSAQKPFIEADAWMFLAVLEHNQARWNESIDATQRALAISKQEGDRPWQAVNLNALAANYKSLGELRKSIAYSEQALAILRELPSPSRYGNTLYNLASCYAALDDYPKALGYYTDALPIFRKMNYPVGQAYILMGLGQVYRRIGDDQRADSYFRQATIEWRKTSNKQDEIFALNATGDLAARRGQFSKAIGLHREALGIARAAGYQRQEETALASLSDVYLSAHETRRALELATQALAISRTIQDVQQEAAELYQQGRAWLVLREYEPARAALERANQLLDSSGSRVRQANVVYELAALDRDTNHLAAARDRILKSLDALEQIGASAGSTESRMLFAASHRRSFDLAIDIEMQLHEHARAFEISERARARTLVDLIRGVRLDIREGADPALIDREHHLEELLDAKYDRLLRVSASPDSPAVIQAKLEIGKLVQEYRDLEGEIRVQSPRYAALLEPRSLSLSDIQAQLPDPHTALIEFWAGDARSYAWLVTKSDCRGFALPPRSQVEALARRAYQALNARNLARDEPLEQKQKRVTAADAAFDGLSEELSRQLLRPLGNLSAFHRLWIVSDGALEYLPFAALPAPGTHTPLIATHEIVRLPSASVMVEIKSDTPPRAPAPRNVAVFADPVFRADDERVAGVAARKAADAPRAADDVDLSRLPRLYFSRREADAIAALSHGSREILDFDASLATVRKKDLRDYRVVHFATHALLDSKNPELSGLVLSMIDRAGRPEDGFLSLHEIYNLKLNASLVVLSACRTALGAEVRGEGLVGLTRGFMYAGAPQVMASLWDIRDNATAWFMTRFYEALEQRHEVPEAALREAQLAMRKDPRWSQPYYWAAFTVLGVR